MSENHKKTAWSFIVLMAMLMSFIALSIDAMLPALGQIGKDLKVSNPNDVQHVVSSIFLGMSMGLVFFGPLADAYGRKPAIYLGTGIFILGCLISTFAQTFEIMILGRLLQGLGGASCRVVTLAMIRDRFEGNRMAKVMSLIMIIFIMVPVFAPSIGQVLLFFANWRFIFVFMLMLSLVSTVWLAFGQEETLAEEHRLPFSLKTMRNGIMETLKNKVARNYTIISGLSFGSFIGYLNSTQQLLQEDYGLGDSFSIAFGGLALMIGLASFANSKWVDKVGMERLCRRALIVIVGLSVICLGLSYFYEGRPPLIILMTYFGATFFCFGILFGNVNSLALQPLGHIAGVANSVISSITTLLSVLLGGFIGYCYNGTVFPIILGFLVLGILSSILMYKLTIHIK